MSAQGRPTQSLASAAMGVVLLCATLRITPSASMTNAISLASETKASASSAAQFESVPRSAGTVARRVTMVFLCLGHQSTIGDHYGRLR